MELAPPSPDFDEAASMSLAANQMSFNAAGAAAALEEHLRGLGRVIVAFSGGVDSSVVMKAATAALGEQALGIVADTESNTDEDLALCREIALAHGFHLEVIRYSELAIDQYADNPPNRCFFCKNELYTQLTRIAAERGFPFVCDGSNLDDMGDYRPGLKAVEAHRVRSPLRELGLRKADVRAIALHYGLPNHDRPASPCLSSRVPYGSPITKEKLEQIGRAEKFLRGLGFVEFRCRHHGDIARLELNEAQFGLAVAKRGVIVEEFRRLGFKWVALDLDGFHSGSLNRLLEQRQIRQA